MRLKAIKAELQETDMTELVAAAGMWKFRCDNLKRDVMEQVKGMGDKMDWETYYPEGKMPLDVEIANYTMTESPRVSGLWHDGNEHLFPRQKMERSTIDWLLTSLNSGRDGQEVLTTMEVPTPLPTSQFRGQGLVNELIRDMGHGGGRNSRLSYDRQ